MKKIFVLIISLAFILPLAAWESLDYASEKNWIICEKDKQGVSFDVFYVYPTLTNNVNRKNLDPNDAKIMEKVHDFSEAQTSILSSDARIFVPLVRQAEVSGALEIVTHDDMDANKESAFESGVKDALLSFEYYEKNFQHGRPLILLGHSQGAMDLYEVLKRNGKISRENGFVAAYLIGLPQTTKERMLSDFAGRDILPASGEDDVGVIIIWNTQNGEADNNFFTVPDGYCINPLNWKTDETPASEKENLGAFFYDYKTGEKRSVPNFCGAKIDAKKGALIVDLPSDSQWDAHGFFGKGVFHMNDFWFFAENTRKNILLRIKKFEQTEK